MYPNHMLDLLFATRMNFNQPLLPSFLFYQLGLKIFVPSKSTGCQISGLPLFPLTPACTGPFFSEPAKHNTYQECVLQPLFLRSQIYKVNDLLSELLQGTLLPNICPLHISSFQFSSVTQSCPTLCDPMNCSTPGLPAHHQLLEFTQTHVHRVSDAIQPSHPLSSPSPPAPIPPSIRVFSNESTLRIRWPKYWSFSFSIIPSKESQG